MSARDCPFSGLGAGCAAFLLLGQLGCSPRYELLRSLDEDAAGGSIGGQDVPVSGGTRSAGGSVGAGGNEPGVGGTGIGTGGNEPGVGGTGIGTGGNDLGVGGTGIGTGGIGASGSGGSG